MEKCGYHNPDNTCNSTLLCKEKSCSVIESNYSNVIDKANRSIRAGERDLHELELERKREEINSIDLDVIRSTCDGFFMQLPVGGNKKVTDLLISHMIYIYKLGYDRNITENFSKGSK